MGPQGLGGEQPPQDGRASMIAMPQKTANYEREEVWVAPDSSLKRRDSAPSNLWTLANPYSDKPYVREELEKDSRLQHVLELADVALGKRRSGHF